MKDLKNIRLIFERIHQAMTKQPSIAKGTMQAKATYRDGLVCDLECGPWKFSADMPQKAGGTETGPAPGQYMMMALGSCQVITTVLWAARYEVPIENLEVIVEVDKDSRGLYGVDEQPARWDHVKYHVNLQSPAPESAIQKVLKAAYEHSPMRGNLEHGFIIEHDHKKISEAAI
jgi:uncharacterized OsmC-like protein